jgi:hypothetical protein
MKRIAIFISIVAMTMTSCDPKALGSILNSAGIVSELDMSNGLKEALNKGVESSVSYLSATDGYYQSIYKVLLPAEAQSVVNKLKIIPGFGNVEEEVVRRINRAAEDAANKAGPIFLGAIKQMTFTDVKNILLGEKNAATQYLNRTTYNPLYDEFKPVIVASLNKFGALEYWADAINAYNRIPFVVKVNPDLADHVSSKALVGLFDLVEKKEYGIRTDISQRSTDLLRKVFAKQD